MSRMDTFPRFEVVINTNGLANIGFYVIPEKLEWLLMDEDGEPMEFYSESEAYHLVRQLNSALLQARGGIDPRD